MNREPLAEAARELEGLGKADPLKQEIASEQGKKLGKFALVTETGAFLVSDDDKNVVLEEANKARGLTHIYQRIATAQPRTGVDIIEEGN